MKYYKDSNNKVYAYELDGSQDQFIPKNLISITKAQADAIRNINISSVPTEVSMAQARQALLQKGYLSNVNTYINGIVGIEGEAARIDWEFRGSVKRDHSLVNLIQVQLNLTDAQMDELFTIANTL